MAMLGNLRFVAQPFLHTFEASQQHRNVCIVILEVNMLSEVPRIVYARADLLTARMNYYGIIA